SQREYLIFNRSKYVVAATFVEQDIADARRHAVHQPRSAIASVMGGDTFREAFHSGPEPGSESLRFRKQIDDRPDEFVAIVRDVKSAWASAELISVADQSFRHDRARRRSRGPCPAHRRSPLRRT